MIGWGLIMEITIKTMDSGSWNDFDLLFETAAAKGDTGCRWCSCMFFQTKETGRNWAKRTLEEDRRLSRRLCEEGNLHGFLAYDRSEPVAWCNAGDRNGYLFTKSRFTEPADKSDGVAALVCLYVLPGYRRTGLSAMLLQYAINHFREMGYQRLEAYPALNTDKEHLVYHGPLSLFLKNGFEVVEERQETDDFGEREQYAVVRLPLVTNRMEQE